MRKNLLSPVLGFALAISVNLPSYADESIPVSLSSIPSGCGRHQTTMLESLAVKDTLLRLKRFIKVDKETGRLHLTGNVDDMNLDKETYDCIKFNINTINDGLEKGALAVDELGNVSISNLSVFEDHSGGQSSIDGGLRANETRVIWYTNGLDVYLDSISANKIQNVEAITAIIIGLIPGSTSKYVAALLGINAALISYHNSAGKGIVARFYYTVGVPPIYCSGIWAQQ